MHSLGWAPHFIIDTGRNGAELQRSDCHGWCNLRGAGAGHLPTMNTGLPDVIDAFYWLKTPGESDGCTRILPSEAVTRSGGGWSGPECPRFDNDCESFESIGGKIDDPRAPEAGAWWDFQARELARHSNLRLHSPGVLDSRYGWTEEAARRFEKSSKHKQPAPTLKPQPPTLKLQEPPTLPPPPSPSTATVTTTQHSQSSPPPLPPSPPPPPSPSPQPSPPPRHHPPPVPTPRSRTAASSTRTLCCSAPQILVHRRPRRCRRQPLYPRHLHSMTALLSTRWL